MGDIQKIDNKSLAVRNKAVDVRRKLVSMNAVSSILTEEEKYILEASTKELISDIDERELVKDAAVMFKYIAIDIGYTIPSQNEWSYILTRLVGIMKRYYGNYTLADIKLAFELATIGKLDDYLPKDSHGAPDRKHYQQFNAEYFSKIFGAYVKRQNEVLAKAYKCMPQERKPMNESEYKLMRLQRNKMIYLRYKYTGKLILENIDDMLLYEWLYSVGLADDVEETKSDRKQAYNIYMRKAIDGIVNKYAAINVRREGDESHEIDYIAYSLGRQRMIKKAFDTMIEDEIQIENYIL
jgi:hypothetical protein